MKAIGCIFGGLMLCLVGLGCGPALTVMRTGGVYPSKSATCKMRWKNYKIPEAMMKYEHIGNIFLAGMPDVAELDSETKSMINAKACGLGGDFVVLGSATTAENGFGVATRGNVHVMVFRERDDESSE